ncbi:peptidoglycan-binding protein [Goodfellowiella coeruleoviolacea]|uniref:Membrane proteins related to metalloendopeptidases n=1 Tax=Goodfellowiella coeruleoviolacea TaxID=334858 RepID=A0AAE3KIA3_9PSEU|nr:peptidoglycan-binding protein [Goodfellowiella coeruleoviolacea]MCP2167767.1 Membrane proteins related to metalloendopeptidases [Goodfellowiella coeruleoviolacea]
MARLMAVLVAALALVGLGVGTASAAAPPAWPLVDSGDTGPEVASAQYLLRAHGAQITADSIFGPQTQAATKAFQTAQGLDADGIVGPLTWAKLVVQVDSGARGDAVTAAQHQLVRHGYALTADGVFGTGTASAVTDFKTKHGLAATSLVDATTWQWLIGGTPTVNGWSLPLPRTALPRSEYDDPHHDYPAIDLPVGTGTRALAVTAGTASLVNDSSCGKGVVVTAAGVRYIYCHLSQQVVAAGAAVTAGQLVGYTGSTGNSTGPHLHFGIKIGSTSHCPQRLLLAIYDGQNPPAPSSLPTSGCSY